jgi:hypothetical protein
MPAKRTTHRSSAGKKLYAVRDAEGKFKDIQTYERAHAQDIKRGSKPEAVARAKSKAKKTTAKKTTAKEDRRPGRRSPRRM